MAKSKKNEVKVDRRKPGDRRSQGDRRKVDVPVAEERRQGLRRKVPRRRQIDPTTCERDYSGDEIEFMQALDAYKRRSGRMFPTCSEILEVIRDLGYVRVPPEQREALIADAAVAVAEPGDELEACDETHIDAAD
jgi:hypothetical protein